MHSPGFSGGLKAGANITNFTNGNFDAVKKKDMVVFHDGGFLNFSQGGISLQPELLITTQGAHTDSANGSYDWKVTYARLPIKLKYRSVAAFLPGSRAPVCV